MENAFSLYASPCTFRRKPHRNPTRCAKVARRGAQGPSSGFRKCRRSRITSPAAHWSLMLNPTFMLTLATLAARKVRESR